MKSILLFPAAAMLCFACNESGGDTNDHSGTSTDPTPTGIIAEPMPSTLASGQSFPTPAATINGWIDNSKVVNNLETNADIITHGWDIWDALTSYTVQKNNDQTLRRFETWYTPADIQTALRSKTLNPEHKLEDMSRTHTGHLEVPHQAAHGAQVSGADVVGFVKCDPSSAQHVYDKELYFIETLKAMIVEGEIANIPAFPATSVLIKPVFYPLTDVDSKGSRNFTLPAWPGYHNQIPMDSVIKKGFGTTAWNNDITITTTGASDPTNKVFSINDFIHFKLTKEQAAQITNVIDGGKAKEGDYAVLVGMHVNTRENRRWTWQTFWWSENPATPQSPSSTLVADLKPSSLDAAASHYAMATAYSMISPSQPNTGGYNSVANKESIKESIYAFNPYLEAGFSSSTFDDPGTPSNPQNSGGNPKVNEYYSKGYQNVGALETSDGKYKGGVYNQTGIQTNCMSCHIQARIYDVAAISDAYQYYVADQYVDLNAPYFKSSVALDFAWSIQGNLISKTPPPKKK